MFHASLIILMIMYLGSLYSNHILWICGFYCHYYAGWELISLFKLLHWLYVEMQI